MAEPISATRALSRGAHRIVVLLALAGVLVAAEQPHVAILSDMEDLSVWEGPFEATEDASEGTQAMLIAMGKGGEFKVRFREFAAKGIQLSDYDIIKFDYKVHGGRVTLDHLIRQWPFLGGFMLEYYPLKDTFVYPDQWTEKVVNLREAENIRGGFDPEQQLFDFSIYAKADDDDVRLYLDNVRFVRRLIHVACDIDDRFLEFGERVDHADGSVTYRYDLEVTNRSSVQQTVRMRVDGSRLEQFVLETADAERQMAAGATEIFPVSITLPASARGMLKPLYHEICGIRFDIPGVVDSDYGLELWPAVPHKLPPHPCLSTTSAHLAAVKGWIGKWGWAKQGANLIITRAETVMGYDTNLPEAKPRPEAAEDRICPACKDETKLYTVTDPISLDRFQCLTCGQMLSPKWELRAPGSMAWWADYRVPAEEPVGQNFAISPNGTIVDLALAWQLTGDRKYAEKAAEFFRAAIRVVPDYPVVRLEAYSIFNSKTASRVGNFFPEFGWCAAMADALDLIWDSNCLSETERRDFLEKVMRPIIHNRLRLENYMVHRVNEFAGGYALLADDAPLAAFIVEGEFGFRKYLAAHMLKDGMSYMAPQYQVPLMSTILPAVARYDNAGINLYSEELRGFFTAWYEWADPEGNSPDLGDSTWVSYREASILWYFEQGYAKFGDPRMALPLQESLFATWQRRPGLNWEEIPRVTRFSPVLLYGAETIPRDKPDMTRFSRDYHDYGILIFNQGSGDKQLWLAMPYGRPLGHGHHDKLHVEWWAMGQKMTKKGGGYATACSAPWWSHPVTHNTLLVDQQDQRNVAGRVAEWSGRGPVQGAVVVHDSMYPGTTVERTVMLYDGLIFFLDRLSSSEGTHTYDFVYKNAGRMITDLDAAPAPALGSERSEIPSFHGAPTGYATLTDIRRAQLTSPLKVQWDGLKTGEEVQVRLFLAADTGNPAELFLAEGPLDTRWSQLVADPAAVYREEKPFPKDVKTQLRGPMLIARRQGERAAFFSFLEPCRGESRITSVEPVDLRLDGALVEAPEGVAYRMVIDGLVHLIMICPSAGIKEYGGIRTRASFNATPMGLAE